LCLSAVEQLRSWNYWGWQLQNWTKGQQHLLQAAAGLRVVSSSLTVFHAQLLEAVQASGLAMAPGTFCSDVLAFVRHLLLQVDVSAAHACQVRRRRSCRRAPAAAAAVLALTLRC
jgi:hypothetical protein